MNTIKKMLKEQYEIEKTMYQGKKVFGVYYKGDFLGFFDNLKSIIAFQKEGLI